MCHGGTLLGAARLASAAARDRDAHHECARGALVHMAAGRTQSPASAETALRGILPVSSAAAVGVHARHLDRRAAAAPLQTEDHEVLTVDTATTVAAADTWRTDIPMVQRVREILQWIQQNQVPLQSTASSTHSSTTINNSAVSSTSDGAISTCANGKNNTNNSSSSSNKHPIGPVAGQLAWVALDDLDLQRAAASASGSGLMAHQQQHLQSATAGGGRDEAEASRSSSLRWSSAARALQQRADLLFVVDSRAAAAVITHPAMCESVVVVVVVDTSTFQVVTALRSVDAAKDWVSASDGVALFDDPRITILQIVDDDEEEEEAADEEDNSASPSSSRPAEDQVDEPDSSLSWLRRRLHALVKWTRDELQGGVEQLPWSGPSFALTVAEQLCNEAIVSSGATKSHPPVGSSSLPPKLLLLRSLLTHLTELEMQQFDAQMAQERFSQCEFSHPQRAFLAKNPSIAMDLLHLLPLANLQQLRSSSSSAASLGFITEAKRSRYYELLLSVCKLLPLVTQSLLRQHLGEYVARDEFTSLAALEAVAFAVRCGDSSSREDDDGALLLDQLDELTCC